MIQTLRLLIATPLRRNVGANFVGRAWTTALGLVFIPIYLRLLGIESYGLVGFFATLQGVFGLLDLGLGVTINRELARLSADPDGRCGQRAALRTLEILYWGVSTAAGVLVFAIAPFIAHHWIRPEHLAAASVQRAVRLMGVVLALQLPFAFYQGALMGLQRQVLLNTILVATATLRAAGTALILWLVAPTIEAFFICQLVVGVVQIVAIVFAAWLTLDGVFAARPEWALLTDVWRFAAATSGNAIVGIALTQLDKVLLSRLLPLNEFGYYALAGSVSAIIWAIAIPIDQALFPRFTQLIAAGDRAALSGLYHRGAQFMAVALVPVATVVALFSHDLIQLWTRDPLTASHTYVIASLLVTGTALNGLISIPGYLQAAAGWPQLMLQTNVAGAIALVPAILVLVPRFGASGGAFVWMALNVWYVATNVPLMHRRLLRGEMGRWYVSDVGAPVAVAVAAGLAARWLAPVDAAPLFTAAYLFGTWLLLFTLCAIASREVRGVVLRRPNSLAEATALE